MYSFVFIVFYESDKTTLNVSYPIVIGCNMFHTSNKFIWLAAYPNLMKMKYADFNFNEDNFEILRYRAWSISALFHIGK